VAAYGLARDQEPATLNNVAFAALHMCVLLTGVLPALRATPLALPAAREAVPA
jgi:cellulose synthase (UDP-forming)